MAHVIRHGDVAVCSSHAAARERRRRDLAQLGAECVFPGLVGIVDNPTGRVPLDEFVRAQAWKAD